MSFLFQKIDTVAGFDLLKIVDEQEDLNSSFKETLMDRDNNFLNRSRYKARKNVDYKVKTANVNFIDENSDFKATM